MLLEKVPNAFETFQGKLKEERNGTVPVAFNLPDRADGETEAGVSVFDICINTIENPILNIIYSQYLIYLKFTICFVIHRLHFTACM